MKVTIEGKPAFAYVHVDLEQGESIYAESDAMSTMDTALQMKAKFNGGFFSAWMKKWLGKESMFVNEFTNVSGGTQRVTLVQAVPGDILEKQISGEGYNLQPGAYLASTGGVKLGVQWAGFGSWIGGEGLFRLRAKGEGTMLYGAYGGLLEKEVDGAYIVDTAHLVGYEPGMKIKPQLAGGIFSSLFGGEGLVMRVEGKGKIVVQTRSFGALTDWLNRYLR